MAVFLIILNSAVRDISVVSRETQILENKTKKRVSHETICETLFFIKAFVNKTLLFYKSME